MNPPSTARLLRRALQPLVLATLAALAAASATPAQAALVARSLDTDASTAEAFYDTVLGITWMRDAGALAAAYGSTQADYATTLTRLAAFNGDASLNFGHTGWRLPTAVGVHVIGGPGCQFGTSGSSDCGENVDTASSELASMFHATLGNLSWRDGSGAARPGVQGVDWGLANTADFDQLDELGYWSSTSSYRLVFGMPQNGQVVFDMRTGTQSITPVQSARAAWLVHDGDIGSAVSTVPLPGTLALSVMGLALLRRRRGT